MLLIIVANDVVSYGESVMVTCVAPGCKSAGYNSAKSLSQKMYWYTLPKDVNKRLR